ncbi:HPF/RaiA family ribosome-associated protein [uncultured Massilia sp.]|uniref:HPF/RaiA family ribosome-associated protein n=1 Tax=uncultured Massilia sp. TaxID=169973 RepID=UPI0025D7AC35|nr:HPF/RaiA family ribosome-associated protein [uncultured Massilia sp.]
MEININTDNTIDRHQGLDERVRSSVEAAIGRFEQVRRVDVHVSNENSQKHEDGSNYCMMEARVSGYAPVVVHAHAENLQLSITAAVGKLQRALDSALGRLNDKKLREPAPVDIDAMADKNLTSGE